MGKESVVDNIFSAFGDVIKVKKRVWSGGPISIENQNGGHRFDSRHRRLLEGLKPLGYFTGVGHSVPSVSVSNIELVDRYNLRFQLGPSLSPEAFSAAVLERTGILSRHFVTDGVSLTTLAVEASKNALVMAGLFAKQISHVVLGATSLGPGVTEGHVRKEIFSGLEVDKCSVEFVMKACASFGFCIERAIKKLEEDPKADHILLIGVDTGSSLIDFTNAETAILFGDGAGALVVSRRPENLESFSASGVYSLTSEHLPQFSGCLFLNEAGKLEMPNGPGVFKQACAAVKKSVNHLLSQSSLEVGELDRLILHQANTRLPAYIAKTFDLIPDKVLSNIRYLGNTCAASPLILASQAVNSGLVNRGDVTILGAVGLGMYSSAALVVW